MLGLGVQGFWGLGFRVSVLGFRFRFWGFGFRDEGYDGPRCVEHRLALMVLS